MKIKVVKNIDNRFTITRELNEPEKKQYNELCGLLAMPHSQRVEQILEENGWFWSNEVLYTTDWNTLLDVLAQVKEVVKSTETMDPPIFSEKEIREMVMDCGRVFIDFIYNDECYSCHYCKELDIFVIYKCYGKTMTTGSMIYIGYSHGYIDLRIVAEYIEYYNKNGVPK